MVKAPPSGRLTVRTDDETRRSIPLFRILEDLVIGAGCLFEMADDKSHTNTRAREKAAFLVLALSP